MVFVMLAAVTVGIGAAAFWFAPGDDPERNEQGWADVCDAVGPDVPRPLAWQFTYRGGRVAASGRCE